MRYITRVLFILLLISCANLSLARELNTENGSDKEAEKSQPTDFEIELGELVIVTGLALMTGYATRFDEKIRGQFVSGNKKSSFSGFASSIGNGWGEKTIGGSFMLGMYAYGELFESSEYSNVSAQMFESGLYAAISTQMLKYAVGRDRPNASDNNDSYSERGRSFPSGHTSFAFALSTAFAEGVDNPSLWRRIPAYSLATLTAYARVHDNKHWTSDVLAGAAIGILSGLYVTKKFKDKKKKEWEVIIAPTQDGGATINGVFDF